jgi:hypothetical protein
MNPPSDAAYLSAAFQRLPPEIRQTLARYVEEASRIFGQALQSIVLYGSAARGEYQPDRSNLNLALILEPLELPALRQYAITHRRWAKEGIIVPLLLTPDDLRRAMQIFPLESVELQEPHVLLAGKEPFQDIPIDRAQLLRQCKQEIHGNLIRLRQRLVEGRISAEAIAILLPLSLTALLPCLRGVLRAQGHRQPMDTESLLQRSEADFTLDLTACKEVWQLKRAVITIGPAEMARLCERYLTSLTSLLDKVAALKEPTS